MCGVNLKNKIWIRYKKILICFMMIVMIKMFF